LNVHFGWKEEEQFFSFLFRLYYIIIFRDWPVCSGDCKRWPSLGREGNKAPKPRQESDRSALITRLTLDKGRVSKKRKRNEKSTTNPRGKEIKKKKRVEKRERQKDKEKGTGIKVEIKMNRLVLPLVICAVFMLGTPSLSLSAKGKEGMISSTHYLATQGFSPPPFLSLLSLDSLLSLNSLLPR